MLKEKKMELQAKTIKRLQEDNLRLTKENKELKASYQEQERIIAAAEKYREEHLKILSALNDAKQRYNEAIREIVAEKKRYRKEFEECIRGLR